MNRHRSRGRWIGAGLAAVVVVAFYAGQAAPISCSSGSGRRPRPAGRPKSISASRPRRAILGSSPRWPTPSSGLRPSRASFASWPFSRRRPSPGRLPATGAWSSWVSASTALLARPNQTPFLLRYYPKAVAGVAAELNRMSPRREIPFEIQPTFENDGQDNGKGGHHPGPDPPGRRCATASRSPTPSSPRSIPI